MMGTTAPEFDRDPQQAEEGGHNLVRLCPKEKVRENDKLLFLLELSQAPDTAILTEGSLEDILDCCVTYDGA